MKRYFLLILTTALTATSGRAQQRNAKPQPAPAAPAPAAKLAASPAPLSAPPAPSEADELACHVLTGRVTDQLDHPLTGATVIVRSRNAKGFNLEPSITNSEGQYMVSAKQPIPRNAVLEISAGGYTTLSLPLANCQSVEARLEPLPGTRFKNDGRIKKTSASGKIH